MATEPSSSSSSSSSLWLPAFGVGFCVGSAVLVGALWMRKKRRQLGMQEIFSEPFPSCLLSVDDILEETYYDGPLTLDEKRALMKTFVASEDSSRVSKPVVGVFASVCLADRTDSNLVNFAIALMLVDEFEMAGVLCLDCESRLSVGDPEWCKAYQVLGRCACSTDHYEYSIYYFNRALSLLPPRSPLGAYLLLGKAEVMNNFALRLEKHPENPRFGELLEEGRAACLEAMSILEKNQLDPLVRVNLPEFVLVDNSTARGDLRMLVKDQERVLARVLKEADMHPPSRVSHAFRDLAQTCLFLFDEENDFSVLAKGEEAAERAAELFGSMPGLAGISAELLLRAELLAAIYTRQGRIEKAQEAWKAYLDFIRANPKSLNGEHHRVPHVENKFLRIESVVLKSGQLDVSVRCKRRLSNKRSWLQPGNLMTIRLIRDGSNEALTETHSLILSYAMLEHPMRSWRVAVASLPVKAAAQNLGDDCKVEVMVKDAEKTITTIYQPVFARDK